MPQRSFVRLAGILALAWAMLNLPLLLGIRVLPSDAMHEFYPMVYFNVHAIRSGLAPWWNPQIFAGYPQIADPQAMLFAPFFMAWMLLRADPGTTWFVWGATLHILIGGLGMLAFLRRLRATDLGAMLGAIVFMAGGVAASRIQYVPILLVYCFSPVALLCIRRFVERPGLKRGLVLGVVAGCMLVVPVQLTYLMGVVLIAYSGTHMGRAWPAWSSRDRWATVAGVLLATIVSAAMALPQLLFSYAFVAVSNRPELPLEAATAMSVDWRSLLTSFAPNALHSLRGSYTGPVDPIETFFYIGAVPATLLVTGIRGAWSNASQRRHILFFAVVAVVAVLYMLGVHTPFYELLYRWVPGVKQFRRPSDSAYLLNLGLAIATGLAASHVDLANRRALLRTLAIGCLWLAGASASMRGTGEGWQAPTLLAPLACLAALLWVRAKPRDVRGIILCVVAVVVVDYRCFNLNGEFNQRSDSGKRFRQDPAAAVVAARIRSDEAAGMPARVEAVDLGATWKNLVVLKGIPAVHGYGPLRWALFDQYFGPYSDGDGPRPSTPYNPGPDSRLDQLLGVRYVVRPPSGNTLTGPAGHDQESLIFRGDKAEVVELASTLPRVLTPASAVVTDHQISPETFAATDFSQTVLLSPRDSTERSQLEAETASCGRGVTANILHRTHIRTTLKVEGDQGGWLILSDPDFPGWLVTVDGTVVPHWRANGMLQAVCVPPGRHVVSFTFHPWHMVSEVVSRPAAWR